MRRKKQTLMLTLLELIHPILISQKVLKQIILKLYAIIAIKVFTFPELNEAKKKTF